MSEKTLEHKWTRCGYGDSEIKCQVCGRAPLHKDKLAEEKADCPGGYAAPRWAFSLATTMVVSAVGTFAFARAGDATVEHSIYWALACACVATTLHRLVILSKAGGGI